MAQEFHDQLTQFLPKMRVWALALTRNRAAAEDLTQDVATKVLVAQNCFTPGTNFSAWVHRIMVNHFISGVRSRREYTDVDTMPEVAVPAAHEDRTALRELGWALERLPRDQREALQMIVLQEQSYEHAAEVTGCAIGTKSGRSRRGQIGLTAARSTAVTTRAPGGAVTARMVPRATGLRTKRMICAPRARSATYRPLPCSRTGSS